MSKREKKKKSNNVYYLSHCDELKGKARTRYHQKKQKPNLGQVIPLRRARKPRKAFMLIPQMQIYIHKLKSILEPLLLGSLVVVLTWYLVGETSRYLGQHDNQNYALLKAWLGEILIIALSWVQVHERKLQISRGILLALLLAYNTWAIVGGIWCDNAARVASSSVSQQVVSELEAQIEQKEALRVKYSGRDMITLSRKYEREMIALRAELKIARADMLKNPSDGLKVNLFMFGIFRLLVMFCNSFLIANFSAKKERGCSPGLRLAYG